MARPNSAAHALIRSRYASNSVVESFAVDPRLLMTEKDSTRITFQALTIVSLGVVLFERVSRLLRDVNRQNQHQGR